MDTAKITTRSNSDILAIQMIANNTDLTSEQRMAAIADRVDGWSRNVGHWRENFTKEIEGRNIYGPLK